GLSWREGLSARPFGPWSRRRQIAYAIALRVTGEAEATVHALLSLSAPGQRTLYSGAQKVRVPTIPGRPLNLALHLTELSNVVAYLCRHSLRGSAPCPLPL